jgi:hypothetical protein
LRRDFGVAGARVIERARAGTVGDELHPTVQGEEFRNVELRRAAGRIGVLPLALEKIMDRWWP